MYQGREKIAIKYEKNPKAFIDYLQIIDDVDENLEEYVTSNKEKC